MQRLPLYQSHKKVEAMKIAAIEINEDGSAKIAPVSNGYSTIEAAPGFKDRFKGSEFDLGYYVKYSDGYESWSPSKVFEEGYTQV